MLIKFIAEILTPSKHTPWRWTAKNRALRILGLSIGICVAIDRGFRWLPHMNGKIVFDDYAVVGKNLRIYNYGDVYIGKFAMFAGEVIIANGGHQKDDLQPYSGSISIGSGVWIGIGAKIVGANISIGDNVIVGAGALVTKSIPSRAIVAGIPAKIIGYRDLPEKVWSLGGRWFSPYTFKLIKD